ncbi:MAG: permease [Kordiimonadales bacterium]|nr:MAG: permease [Kordiimonadales bacterium]
MSSVSVALDNARADIKGSDGRLLILTQTLLIFFLLTLSLTSASVQRYLSDNLDSMLGADMAVTSYDALASDEVDMLTTLAARRSTTQLMTLTLAHKGAWQRAQLKLIDDIYPLQGELKTGASRSAEHVSRTRGPGLGEIWIGPRLSTKLKAAVGDVMTLGDTQLAVTAIVFHEPDRLMEGHSVAMRAMVHSASLKGANLDGTNNRYRYLLEANASERSAIEAWVAETLPAAEITKKDGGSHPLALFWQRTENFLGLASVILFFMAAVAVDMANRRHLVRQKHRLALYLSFGTRLSTGLKISLFQWGLGFIASLCIGTALAYVAEGFLIGQLADQFPGISWGWHTAALVKTTLLTLALLLAFQAPALWQLKSSSVASLIRAQDTPRATFLRTVWGFSSLAMLASFYSDNALLTGMTLAAMGGALLLMLLLTWLVLTFGELWARRRPGLLPFSFFMMKQRIFSKSTQILGLGLCGLLLLFTLMLMQDIRTSMDGYVRSNDGNLLISAAQPKHMKAIETWASSTGSVIRALRPFTNAQLVKINGAKLDDFVTKPSDTLSNVKSPIRLSWSEAVPDNNRVVDGNWWQPGEADWHRISAEPEVLTDLGLALGDTLTFQIDGKLHDFKLTVSHAFRPGRGSITFWFQVPPLMVTEVAPSVRYIGSMELPDAAWGTLDTLWQQFPDLSMVPLKELTARFDATLAMVTKLTVGFAAMVLLMAGVVIAASIKGFEADDRQKNGLLMSMGLGKRDCMKLSFYDWLITALIAGSGAAAGTWLAGLLIYQSQFSLAYSPDPAWLIGSVLVMCAVVCSIGLTYSRRSLSASVTDLLAD